MELNNTYLLVDLDVDHDTLLRLALQEAVETPLGVVRSRTTELSWSVNLPRIYSPEAPETATSPGS